MLSRDLLRLAQQPWADLRPHVAKAPEVLGQFLLPCRLESISANHAAHRVERRAVRNRHLRRRGDRRRVEGQKPQQSSGSSHLRPIESRTDVPNTPAPSQRYLSETYVAEAKSSKAETGDAAANVKR